MAAIPFYLQQGYCLIYGSGSLVGTSGLQAQDTTWKFGMIQDINYLAVPIYQFHIGDSVLFKETDVRVRLAWDNYPYTEVETAKLAGREFPPV
jgi:hypothetical protein